jgi:hypothetical protein
VGGQKQIILYHTETVEPLGILPFPEGFQRSSASAEMANSSSRAAGLGASRAKWCCGTSRPENASAQSADEVDQVLAADLSADHQFVALGGPDKVVKVYSTKDGALFTR